MILRYNSDYNSIKPFNPIELNKFTILTGINGSGKSQLLTSLTKSNTSIDGINKNQIVLFNYLNFRIENESNYNNQVYANERSAVWNQIKTPNASNIYPSLKQYKDQLGPENYFAILEIANGKPFLGLKDSDFGDNENLKSNYNAYKNNTINYFESIKDQQIGGYFTLKNLLLKSPKLIDSLTQDEFEELFEPTILVNDFLPTQISNLFGNYWSKYQIFELRKFRNGINNVDEIKQEFTRKKQKPWDLINNIFAKFDTFNFRINNPEDIDFIDPQNTTPFVAQLIHKDSRINVSFNDLSSGEKIILSLVLSIYKSSSDGIFPKLLLLDEVDASLHPSQIKNMIDVIKDVFVSENDVNVILATHSPSTIALAEEENIFVVNPSGQNRIEKQSKSEALKILSQGFITLEESLGVFDKLTNKELSIFTEGDNIDLLKKGIELLEPTLLEKVDFIDNLRDKTGKNQLQYYFEMLTRVQHDKNILFVFDCDVTNTFNDSNKTFHLILDKNIENRKVKKGIENLFPENLFLPELYDNKLKDDGGDSNNLNKKKFLKFLLERNTKEDFLKFNQFISKVKILIS
jgi:ABC-type iron transport system FetAB ATPase subunit